MTGIITDKTGWNLDNSYTRLPEIFWVNHNPSPVKSPELIKLNTELARSLGLDAGLLSAGVLSGNRLPDSSRPMAQAYAGHQFGYFTMLGDGRAILIGEQLTPGGERFDIQLKGSGRTPFSRGGDGRAALGPMLREYIISEAMHGLGIATTRSLAVVTTGEPVYRDTVLPGAILTRVASSHIRVGTFEYAARYGESGDLRALADYTLDRHFDGYLNAENPYVFLLEEVVRRQARLIAGWQLVGFIHGVMNTDNMALCGETIDYGPCAFMDTYDPQTVFSSIDRYGRYAYGNQPNIGAWNLTRFAETLIPLLNRDSGRAEALARTKVSEFHTLYQKYWHAGMKAKLGLTNDEPGDAELIRELLLLMYNNKADYTNTFLALTFDSLEGAELYTKPEFLVWHKKWSARDRSFPTMKNANPALIPRNHRVEKALDTAVNNADYSVTDRLLAALVSPFAHTREQTAYAQPDPSSCGYKTFCGT
ncbi:MAG: YdiU family protein [Eubacteriales bacterium]|nr:YdiU family protein [Eubacteriales bacterium]